MKPLKFTDLKSGLLMLLLFLLSSPSISQKLHTRSGPAIRNYEKAEDYVSMKAYMEAVASLRVALENDSDFIEAHLLLAQVYAGMEDFEKAVSSFRKVILLNPDFYPNAFYQLGKIELESGLYDSAFAHLNFYVSMPAVPSGLLAKTKKFIEKSKFGMEGIRKPVPFDAVSLGEGINTNMGEYSPAISVDGNQLFFTRLILRPEGGMTQEDIFFSTLKEGKWSLAKNMGSPVNTDINDGTVHLSPDGNGLFITSSGHEPGLGGADIWELKKSGDRWNYPVNLGPNINSPGFDSQPCMSSDGRTLYFVSKRKGGMGGTDIYRCVKGEDQRWGPAENLGAPINTEEDDQSPFIHPDGMTLYFSSKGHPGFGKSDLYISRLESDGKWGIPVNLGYPINTWADERNLTVDAKGQFAYLATDRFKAKNDYDIYAFKLDVSSKPLFVNYLKGNILDKNTKLPLEANFELMDLETGTSVIRAKSNPGNGAFLVCLPAGKNYGLQASKDGYLFYSENFFFNPSETDRLEPIHKEIPLSPVSAGERIILRNVFFNTNSSELLPESMAELKTLVVFLEKNPGLIIELSGHTDNEGSPASNLELSEKRALSVLVFLKEKGIKPERLKSKGFGQTKPIAGNDTPEGRAQNRRTEFTILDKP